MRVRVIVLALAMAGLAAVGAPASHAATGGVCSAKAGVTLSPGISQTPTKGTFTGVAPLDLYCVGQINGVNVGGKATKFSFSGSYGPGDTCATGKGSGKLSATLPKVGGGSLSVSGTFTFTRDGSDVVIQGTLGGQKLKANFQFIPAAGQTCFTTAVKSATVAGAAEVGA